MWRAGGVGVVLRGLGTDVFRYQERRVILCSYQVMQELFSHVVFDLGFTYHKRFGWGGGVYGEKMISSHGRYLRLKFHRITTQSEMRKTRSSAEVSEYTVHI